MIPQSAAAVQHADDEYRAGRGRGVSVFFALSGALRSSGEKCMRDGSHLVLLIIYVTHHSLVVLAISITQSLFSTGV